MRKIAAVIILACLLVGMTTAASMCPLDSNPEEMIPPVHTEMGASTLGVCEGVIGASHFTGFEHVSEGVRGTASMASSLLSVGSTQYVKQVEYGTSELGMHYDGVSGVDVVGRAAYQESALTEVMAPVDGDLANTTPVCVHAYDEVGGVITQGLVGTQVSVVNYPESMMSLQVQTGVGPSSMASLPLASGSFYTRSSIGTLVGDGAVLAPTLGAGMTMQDNTYWNGKFQLVHQFSYSVTNLGTLSRDLTEEA